jgi:HEPN domain-containing protein
MALDPMKAAEVREWMRLVENDLRAIKLSLDASPPLVEDALFHCQQAVEKAYKAFLTWHNQPFRKTHDLAELGQECVALDPFLEPVCRRAEKLTAFATLYRYPGDGSASLPPAKQRRCRRSRAMFAMPCWRACPRVPRRPPLQHEGAGDDQGTVTNAI